MRQFFCRKEIVHITQTSLRTVIRNEKAWGLEPHKLNQRVVRYEAQKTLRKLRQRGVI